MIEEKETITLVCDNCGYEIEGFKNIDELIKYTRKNGWGHKEGFRIDLKNGMMDICPKCVKKNEEENR